MGLRIKTLTFWAFTEKSDVQGGASSSKTDTEGDCLKTGGLDSFTELRWDLAGKKGVVFLWGVDTLMHAVSCPLHLIYNTNFYWYCIFLLILYLFIVFSFIFQHDHYHFDKTIKIFHKNTPFPLGLYEPQGGISIGA